MQTYSIKVARVAEIFRMWYFTIFYGKTIICLKYWFARVEKDLCLQQYWEKILFWSFSPWKCFLKKYPVIFSFNSYTKIAVSFTEACFILKLRYQFLNRGLPVQGYLCKLIFPIFLLSNKHIKSLGRRSNWY